MATATMKPGGAKHSTHSARVRTRHEVAGGTPIGPAVRAEPDARRTWTCPGCGHVLRVSGLGRHRVYFEPADERSADPVMGRACPACGRGLPGKNPPVWIPAWEPGGARA
jgi:hypothetical protein